MVARGGIPAGKPGDQGQRAAERVSKLGDLPNVLGGGPLLMKGVRWS